MDQPQPTIEQRLTQLEQQFARRERRAPAPQDPTNAQRRPVGRPETQESRLRKSIAQAIRQLNRAQLEQISRHIIYVTTIDVAQQ